MLSTDGLAGVLRLFYGILVLCVRGFGFYSHWCKWAKGKKRTALQVSLVANIRLVNSDTT